MKTNHLPVNSSCVYAGSVWKIETRVGGVYQISRGGETKLVRRASIKRYIPARENKP